ncbi:hypothetical protein GW17_00040105, partial [Ensete ventricosum]
VEYAIKVTSFFNLTRKLFDFVSQPIALQEPSSLEKVTEIDKHIRCAMSGLIVDACTLVEHARVETQVLFI